MSEGLSSALRHDSAVRSLLSSLAQFLKDNHELEILGRENRTKYAYDGLGRMAAQLNGGVVSSSFVYDGDNIVAAYRGSGLQLWEAAWGPGQDALLEWVDTAGGTGSHLPVADPRNSIVGMWGVQAGALSSTVEYNAEGRATLRDSDGTVTCQEDGSGTVCGQPAGSPFGFTSAWRSDNTGLVYMRARWYSTQLGEFLSTDEAVYSSSFNLYAYAAFDPINRWDPFGLTDLNIVVDPQMWANWNELQQNFKAAGFTAVNIVVDPNARFMTVPDAEKLSPTGDVTVLVRTNFTLTPAVLGRPIQGETRGRSTWLYVLNIVRGAQRVWESEGTPPEEQAGQMQTLLTNIAQHEIGHGLGLFSHSSDPGNVMTSEPEAWMRKAIRPFSTDQLRRIQAGIPARQSKTGRGPDGGAPRAGDPGTLPMAGKLEPRKQPGGVAWNRPPPGASRPEALPSANCRKNLAGCGK